MITFYQQRESSTYRARKPRVIKFSSCCAKRSMGYATPRLNDKGVVISVRCCSKCGKEE